MVLTTDEHHLATEPYNRNIVEVPLFCTLIASYALRKQKNIHFVKSPFRLSVTSSESMWILAHIEGTDFVGSKRGML